MLYPNKIIIISGSSGSGKTTLVNYLMLHAAFNLTFSVSACSRQKRPLETHGKNYFFLSVEEFKEKIHNNQFLEWEEVYKDHFYGTLKSSTMDILNSLKSCLSLLSSNFRKKSANRINLLQCINGCSRNTTTLTDLSKLSHEIV